MTRPCSARSGGLPGRFCEFGRRLSFGSDSGTGARFTALMYSVVGTLILNRIDVLRWLEAWLAACADNGGRPPDDTAARRRELTAPT